MRPTSQLLVACGILALCSCSHRDGDDVAKLKTELDAAKAEAAALRAELAQVKALLNAPHSKDDAKPDSEEAKVLAFGKAFVADIEENRLASAYRSTSAAYQKQVERKAFDEMIEKHAVRKLEQPTHHQTKVRKSPDGKEYEFYCTAHELNSRDPLGPVAFGPGSAGVGPRVNFALTVSSENGAWKANSVEIKLEK
jgi:hypothetical protein